MHYFKGSQLLIMDAKGRFGVPTRQREALVAAMEGGLVLTPNREQSLILFPKQHWDALAAKIRELPALDPMAALLRRMIIGMAEDVEMDGAGRLLVPPELRKYACLEKEIRFVGQDHYFEIWSEANWQKQTQIFSGLKPEDFANLSPSLGNLRF